MTDRTNENYIPGIDGLRAIAVLAVIIYHADFFTFMKGGFTGVDIFFVISGYVISKSLFTKSSLRFPGYLSLFYKRRFLRLLPALILCLTATVTATVLFIPSSWLSRTISETGLSAFLGYGNIAFVLNNDGYFSPNVDFNPFLHTWSLAVEEQFYLIYPLLFFIWLKHKDRKSLTGILTKALPAVLCIASVIFAYFETASNHDRAFYLLPSRFWELAAGALLFMLHSENRLMPKSRTASIFLMICGLALLIAGFFFTDQNTFPFPWAFVPVSGALLIICGAVKNSCASPGKMKILDSSAMVYIGKISYSLYLWHWPVSALFRWTVGFDALNLKVAFLAATFLPAVASYHLLEIPVRTGKFFKAQKNRRVISGGLVAVLLFYSAARYIMKSQPVISLSVTKNVSDWYSRSYHNYVTDKNASYPDLSGKRLFITGDSHTAAYRTMIHEVSVDLKFRAYEFEEGGCPVIDLMKPMALNKGCETFYNKTIDEIKKLARPGDVVFLASLRMPVFSDQFEVPDEASVISEFNNKDAAENRRLALEEADRLIGELTSIGAIVLIDAPKPVLKAPPYRCSDWFNKMNPICSPGLTIDREMLLKVRKPVMDSLDILKARHKNLRVWDPFYVLCGAEECSAYDENGKPLFLDGDHLSGHGNRVIAPSFRNKLLEIWRK